jgi:hypothetical protein
MDVASKGRPLREPPAVFMIICVLTFPAPAHTMKMGNGVLKSVAPERRYAPVGGGVTVQSRDRLSAVTDRPVLEDLADFVFARSKTSWALVWSETCARLMPYDTDVAPLPYVVRRLLAAGDTRTICSMDSEPVVCHTPTAPSAAGHRVMPQAALVLVTRGRCLLRRPGHPWRLLLREWHAAVVPRPWVVTTAPNTACVVLSAAIPVGND